MEKEFNLSEKRFKYYNDGNWVWKEKDLKEFIKRFKKETKKRSYTSYNEDNQKFKEIDLSWVFDEIDKLAGDKLI